MLTFQILSLCIINKIKLLTMIKILSLFTFILFNGMCFSQQALKENQFEGYIILKNGERKEGIVEVKNNNHPWSFQEAIKFFDKELLNQEKVKKGDKKEFKPGEVTEYGFADKRYVLVSYTNNNQAEGNALNAGIGALKSATQTKHFAEVYREGIISLYRFYNSPPDFYITSGDAEAKNMAAFIEECKTTYDILIEKGEEKAKAFDDISVKKFFKDCQFVVEKYEDKKYTKQPVKGLKSMIRSAMLRGEALANAAMEMIIDYEANCAK